MAGGSGLLGFLISVILLIATGAIFFLVIDRMAPDPLLNRIGKIAVGTVLLVVFLLIISAVLFGTGGAVSMSPSGFIWFCIGVIVILVVLFIIDYVLGLIASGMGIGEGLVNVIKFVIFAVALIALLVLADKTLMGGSYTNSLPFRLDHRSQLPTVATQLALR